VPQRPFLVPADHPSLPGHFPGQPVVPGVVILDEVAAFAASLGGAGARVVRIPQVKFVAPLLPGQDAMLELDTDASGARVRFRVVRGADLIASGELVLEPA
jgi:3-hydroxymyristoyl/3-hydroxydecanoyl-(acyl carrier protein) dehydratase